jgi:hypothetical protein
MLLAAVAVLIGLVCGETEVGVASVEAMGDTPMNRTGESCPEQIPGRSRCR